MTDYIIPATRYADPTVDFAFKRIFGTETYKQNTVNLLNDLIPDIGIVDVTFLNTEIQGETSDSRKGVIDVCCEDVSGKQFIIEMQNASQVYFRERTLFYASKFISMLGKPGDWDYQLPPVYVVSFLGFPLANLHLANQNGRYLLHYTLQDVETHEKMGGGTEFIFLGLRDFKKSEKKLASNPEKWLFLLQNSSSLKEIPETFRGDGQFSHFFDACERAGFSKAEEMEYIRDMMTKNDIENSKREACARAKAEGKVEGKAEGAAETRREVAKKMKADGLDTAMISKYFGLSIEEINEL